MIGAPRHWRFDRHRILWVHVRTGWTKRFLHSKAKPPAVPQNSDSPAVGTA